MIIKKSRPILDRSPPGLTMTASFAIHQGGHDTFTTGRTTTSKFRGRDNIAIASRNVRTLRLIGKLKELTHEIERYNWHLLGICEQRWKNCREKTPKKDTHCTSVEKKDTHCTSVEKKDTHCTSVEKKDTHCTSVEKKSNTNLVSVFLYIRTLKTLY